MMAIWLGKYAVVSGSVHMPAFGQADLSNCEREQIQYAGSIQPHGALLVVSEPDYVIIQASANASEFLGLDEDVLDKPLSELSSGLATRVMAGSDEQPRDMLAVSRCQFDERGEAFDCFTHRSDDGNIILEFERAGPALDVHEEIESAIRTFLKASSIESLCDAAAQFFKPFTGYDRVMVYRFDDEGHGEIFSEVKEADLEAFLGNRYPATDIPQIARQLYIRNRVRVLVDVGYEPVQLRPRLSPITGQDLDMSMASLRSHSPIHVQYLKNMGVAATLVASLVVGGKLWGLLACHHYKPRFLHYQVRLVCDLLCEVIATRIAALQSFQQAQAELSVRRIEQRLVQAVAREGDWRGALFDNPEALLQPMHATGAALLYEDKVISTGDVPGTKQLREVGEWLDTRPRARAIATSSLVQEAPEFADIVDVAGGVLAAPLSTMPGEYIVWFRPERIKHVTWGGDPHKPMVIGDDPADLSPRRSFAKWHEDVEGTCDPWSAADLAAARIIGETLRDVIAQFRSVQLLIAQDQLEAVSRQLRESEQPVIIADANGRILRTNESFEELLPDAHTHLQRVQDLPVLFTDPSGVRRTIEGLLSHRRVWRGEVSLKNKRNESIPLFLRADPVFSSPERVLGFVLLFTDLTDQRLADDARRECMEETAARGSMLNRRLNAPGGFPYQNLIGSIIENAELATLEIGDTADPARMRNMLECIQSSVHRTTDLLDHLFRYSSGVVQAPALPKKGNGELGSNHRPARR